MHEESLTTENSVQQASQIGAEERCGRGVPQRVQGEGSSAQDSTSMGLRNTRTTARQREVSEGGRSNARKPELLLKTHLTGCAPERAAFENQYTRCASSQW